jgi:hypothetical protein
MGNVVIPRPEILAPGTDVWGQSGLGKVGRHLQIDPCISPFPKPRTNNAKSSALQKNNDLWHVR